MMDKELKVNIGKNSNTGNEGYTEKEKFFIGVAFAFFIVISVYKLTNASLWFDEAIEYWYSKILVGNLPYSVTFDNVVSSNMYERVIATYQPPLYNFLLYFWLKISDSVWWFRFFGIVMGFVSMLGIFKSVKLSTRKANVASLAVIMSSCIYQLLYYWQECAEYCLMLASLCWCIYFWIKCIKDLSRKNIVIFTIAAIIPIYSQYGAIFPIVSLAISLLVYCILKKNIKRLVDATVSFIGALVFAGLPLYLFFVKKQMFLQQGGSVELVPIAFEGNIVSDAWGKLHTVFRWCLASVYSIESSKIILCILLICFIFVVIKGDELCRYFVVVNALTWVMYYLAVKMGVYAYGGYGGRYSLFFIPMWIISDVIIIYQLYCVNGNLKYFCKCKSIYTGVMLVLCTSFCMLNWTQQIQDNWEKEDNAVVVSKWFEVNAQDSNTLVYYGAKPGFSYYIRQNKNFSDSTEDNVVYMSWDRDKTQEEYTEYIKGVYGVEWPNELYIIATHFRDDLETLIGVFTDSGYIREDIYSRNGMLTRLSVEGVDEER